MNNSTTREVSFDDYLNLKNQGEDQLVIALFYAPDTEKSQLLVEKAKEIVPQSGGFLLLVDKNEYHQEMTKIYVNLDPTLIFYKQGEELCRVAGKTDEIILKRRLEALA